MSRNIEKQVLKLWRRVFGSMRSGKWHNHKKRFVSEKPFRVSEKLEAVIGYKIGVIVEVIVVSVFHFISVHIESVVIKARIANQCWPFFPTGRNIRPVILIEIFAEECFGDVVLDYAKHCDSLTRPIASITQIRGKSSGLVSGLPLRRTAVIVIGLSIRTSLLLC